MSCLTQSPKGPASFLVNVVRAMLLCCAFNIVLRIHVFTTSASVLSAANVLYVKTDGSAYREQVQLCDN